MADIDNGNQITTLKADVSRVRADMGDLAHHLIIEGKTLLGGTKEKLGMEVHKKVEKVRERGKQAATATEHMIAEHPLQCLLGAFGVGILASKLMSHRRHQV